MKSLKRVLNPANSNGKILGFFLAALCCLSFQAARAQSVPTTKTKTPEVPVVVPNVVIVPNQQCPPGTPCSTPKPYPKPTPPKETKVIANESDTPAEKLINTESKVNIGLCVKEGSVRINGWDRDEIRAYVEDGSQVGFKIVQEGVKSKKPVWVAVLGFDPQKTKEVKPEECLSGREIELDVPRSAIIKLKSGESDIKIESVGKVSVESLSGDVYLNDISGGIEARTYQGDLTVEKSSGQMILNNTAGNIIALDVAPGEIGDILKANTTSGRIILKAVEHRQIETGSASGSTLFDGDLLNGGQYTFSTQNGSIVLAVSPTSSCKINAWFGFGAFASEIPLQNILKKEQSVSAQIGAGETNCSLNLKTGSGVIRVRSAKTAAETVEKSPREEEKSKPQVTTKTSNTKNVKPSEPREKMKAKDDQEPR